jgi:general secretion pathway protein I
MNFGRSIALRRRRAGFTLLEVLTALVIFALAAAVLGASYVNVLNAYVVTSRGMQVNEDFAFARQLVLTESDREKLEQGGEFQTAGNRQVKWSVEITSTQTADLFNVAFTCEVTDPGQAEPTKTEQKFMLLRPTWSTDLAEQGKLKEDDKARILEIQGQKAR